VTFIELPRLLDGGRSPGHPVAILEGELIPFDRFERRVAAVAAQAKARGGTRWLLASEDAWDFAVGFFGLLRAGCAVAIPPNHLPATLERLQAEVDGVLTDQVVPEGHPWCPLPGDGNIQSEAGPLEDGWIDFWTSGSTGEAKRIRKRLSQLSAEVRILEATFGTCFEGGPVLGTVPHQHIYGCLFRILWPLAAGRPFVNEQCADPDRFRFAMARSEAPALVCSPALLARLPDMVDLDHYASGVSAVFSSGGPLKAADAIAWRRWVPRGVMEIYGSTETGGIAWRVQSEDPDSACWTPFADVALTCEGDGALRVQSERVGIEPVRMEDAAEALPDGRFRLMGRLDRIVKLEEKRVSLPELEAALEEHPWVARAAVVPLEYPRPNLGAVVVLAKDLPHGVPAERRQLGQTLRRHLGQRFEPVALPKRWRFVDELPYNDRGKLTHTALAALFQA
jgi:acyl-coenzyme A synthetase/AMP-(fatty) acid ligase